MSDQPSLPTFERKPVHQACVRITKAGDGLSEALKIAPKALHLDDEVFYVLRGVVRQVNHRAVYDAKRDEEILTRLHTVEAVDITEVAPELARKLLNEAAESLARAQAEGQLPFDGEEDDDA